MKTIYTFLLCVVASSLFAQDTNSAPIINEPFDVKTKGFWVAASYGYNTRSFIPDFYQPSEKNPGHFAPKAYMAGSMPMLEAGYAFNGRLGVYAAFVPTMAYVRKYDNTPGSGFYTTKTWYASLGGQFYLLNKKGLFSPYVKAAFNGGKSNMQSRFANSSYKELGGHTLGGTIALGTDVKITSRLFATVETAFSQLTYQPKEHLNVHTGTVTPYSTDLSDGFHPNYGWVYNTVNALPEQFNMRYISFRVGLRYNFFGN